MISEKIKEHLVNLVNASELPNNEKSLEITIKAFEEKLNCYEKQVADFDLIDVKEFNDEGDSGALVITYSGSLLSIGPKVNDYRRVEYISIGLRKGVPQKASNEHSKINGNFTVDNIAKFISGPIMSSSAIYKIAKVSNKLKAISQEEVLHDVTKILIEDFVEVNNTIIV